MASSADSDILAYFRRFTPARSEVEAFYASAFEAKMARLTEVTITSSSFPEGGSATGEISGDPGVIMATAEAYLNELDGVADSADNKPGMLFSRAKNQLRT
jgi:formylmethanofuran:tetrahydromethanopterin formyltransferase